MDILLGDAEASSPLESSARSPPKLLPIDPPDQNPGAASAMVTMLKEKFRSIYAVAHVLYVILIRSFLLNTCQTFVFLQLFPVDSIKYFMKKMTNIKRIMYCIIHSILQTILSIIPFRR